MNYIKILPTIFAIFSIVSCSTDDSGEIVTPQETFSNWSPGFTNQTSNFTQTRTGSQGTQQTRTIEVTSSSNSSSLTEESIDKDINNDGDLYEDIDEVITTYLASENLGSHNIVEYKLIEDNDLGFKVGNRFYPLSDGIMKNYGHLDYDLPCTTEEEDVKVNCNGKNLYNIDLVLISKNHNYTIHEQGYIDWSGSGPLFYFELWKESNSSLSGGNFFDLMTRTNETFKLDFNFGDYYNYNIGENNESKFQIWTEQNTGCNGLYELGSENFDDCQIFGFYNTLSTNSFYQTEGDPQSSGEEHEIEWTNGSLEIFVDSNNVYTVKLKGATNGLNLPVSLFYKGYLAYL